MKTQHGPVFPVHSENSYTPPQPTQPQQQYQKQNNNPQKPTRMSRVKRVFKWISYAFCITLGITAVIVILGFSGIGMALMIEIAKHPLRF